MDQVNLWILIPSLILFALVTIPVVYIWVIHYSARILCCASKQNSKSEEVSDVETGTTEVPELQSVAP